MLLITWMACGKFLYSYFDVIASNALLKPKLVANFYG